MSGSRFPLPVPLVVLLVAIVVAGAIIVVWGFLRYKSPTAARNPGDALPAELRAYFELENQASNHRLRGDYREAIACYERLSRLPLPKGARSLADSNRRMIAECYLGLGQPTKGEQIYNSLLAKSPSDESLLREVGTYWKTRGELEKALELF